MSEENFSYRQIFKATSIFGGVVCYTGTLGSFFTLKSSPHLLTMTFKSYDYTLSFLFLSMTLFFCQFTLGKDTVLVNTRKLNRLTYANMSSSFLLLIITLPLHFFHKL